MPSYYKRPGVYLEESLLVNPSDAASTFTVGAFVGCAGKGPINLPQYVQSWTDFVTLFGAFDPIQGTVVDPNDVTTAALGSTSYANLAALQGDASKGTGMYTGPVMTAGQYVTLGDASKNHYTLPALSTNRRTAAPGQMFAVDTNITASDSTNAAKLAGGTAEVQTLTMTGAPTGGTFTITLPATVSGGATTAAIAFNAIGTAIKSALDAALAGNTIAVAGGPLTTTPVTLTFTGYGDVDPVTVNISGPTGGTTPAIAVVTTTPGVGEGFTALPTTAWTAGQSIWIGSYAFYWNSTAWTAGTGGGGTAKANAGTWSAGAVAGSGVSLYTPKVLSYLPYAVYSFFQNGGRFCWVVRAAPTVPPNNGAMSKVDVAGKTGRSFTLQALSPGVWGNSIKYALSTQGSSPNPSQEGVAPKDIFAIQILVPNSQNVDEVVETFTSMSVAGDIPGTRSVITTINDSVSGSRYVTCQNLDTNQPQPQPPSGATLPVLAGGVDPGIPDPANLTEAAKTIATVDGPVTLNITGYMSDITSVDTPDYALDYVSAALSSYDFPDRTDLFVVNDSCPPRVPGTSASTYKTIMTSPLLPVIGDSYSASYGPWVIIAHPSRIGASIAVPPGGAIMGMMARIDATVGVFRAPAGVIAGLANAVGVQTKFSDTELGDLNAQNINIVRSVVGAGICVMGGRTRKSYGADKYISARRTLIYLEESLKRSTQYAVFENNDQRLWSSLKMTAERILRPLWERGGLAGASAAEAYYITCNDTINTPQVIQSGEVRMEVGVALEYPAEFIVIRITQFDRGTFTSEVTPTS